MKTTKICLSLIVVIALLVACSKPIETQEEDLELTILTASENMNMYLKYFEIKYPDVKINIVDANILANKEPNKLQYTHNELLFKVMSDQINSPDAPDMIFTSNPVHIIDLMNAGLLKPLDTFIDESQFDIDGIAPFVREGLRDMGDGAIYALSPTFETSGLLYNKAIFEEKGIPYLSDHMTWDEIFNLARELSFENDNGEHIYGMTIGLGDLYSQSLFYSDLTMFDEDYKNMNVRTSSWERVWQLFIDLEKEGILAPIENWNEYRVGHSFISGKTAMQFITSSAIKDIAINIEEGSRANGQEPFSWDIVTVPTHEARPDIGLIMQFNALMAITDKGDNSKLAWELIQYLHGAEVAKQLAKSGWELVSRIEYNEAPTGLDLNLAAFGALKPPPLTQDKVLDFETTNRIHELGRHEFQLARNGEKSVAQALHDLQIEGQKVLDHFHLIKK